MWVFAGGMFRSGSTLQYQIVSTLIEQAGLGRRVEWRMPEEFVQLADETGEPDEMLVFKTHVCKHPMRERLRDGRALAVAAHRDLRDVIVSGADKDGRELTPDYCRELAGGCLACYNGWPTCDAIRWWPYDRLTHDTASVTLEMAGHLDLPCTPDLARALADEFAPDRQRRRIDDAVREGQMVAARPGGRLRHTRGDLLHPNHLKDGRTGKWRDRLSPESLAVIEEVAGEWLTTHGYELSGNVIRKAAI
ncbi:MAG: hypothetical protein H6810_07005 [Phycisphaeraceae bacterium]|nr:MAG: hypothetical protein H6810_07005 [Phycisphaeraceae bacterium]